MQMLTVVVVPLVLEPLPHSKELTQIVETLDAQRALCDRKLVSDLVSGRVASSPWPVWLPDKADREASFSVYKTDHPATELAQPFLLVFRTRHVVTIVNVASDDTMSSARYTGFSSIWPDAHRAVTSSGGSDLP